MDVQFSQESINEINRIIAQYPKERKKSALLPVLHVVQKETNGWLSVDTMDKVADILAIKPIEVYEVVTFYTMYFRKPMGKYHIQVCTNVSCMLRKGDEIYKQVSEMLQVGHNETTPDGLFSLEEVECMGACGGAPMIAINEDYYENIDIIKVEKLIEGLK